MKSRLLILSDLWGIRRSDWIGFYLKLLEAEFDVCYYDCCELGDVDTSEYCESALHSQFVDGGIDAAVEKLLEKETDRVDVLAFSIGGTIAWKAALKGLKIANFYAVSATRLRYESQKPVCSIKLFYGEKDKFKPTHDWFERMEIPFEVMHGADHLIYAERSCSEIICNDILNARK